MALKQRIPTKQMFFTEIKEDARYLKLFETAQRLLKGTNQLFTVVSNATGVELYKITFINMGKHTYVTEKDLNTLIVYIKGKPYTPHPSKSIGCSKKTPPVKGSVSAGALELRQLKLEAMDIILNSYEKKFTGLHLFCEHLGVSNSYGSYIRNRNTNLISLRVLNKFYKALKGKDYPVPDRLKASLA